MLHRLFAVTGATLLLTVACASARSPAGALAPASPYTVAVQCNNTGRDAATLNDAIERSPTGSEIVISGRCSLTGTVVLRGDRSYRGTSRTGAVLRQANDTNLAALLTSDSYANNDDGTGQPVTVRNLTLEGNRENNGGSPTDGLVLRSWKSSVEDLNVNDFGGSGIRLTNLSANDTPIGTTQVNGRIANNTITASGRHGVYVQDTENTITDWQLRDNWIADSTLDGVRLENSAGWMIERNHVYGVGNNAIWAERLYGSTVSDNYVEGYGEGGAGMWYGIGVTVNGGAASTIALNRVFAFEGERPDSAYRYIGVDGLKYGVGVLAVTGNTVRGFVGARGTGLFYSAEGGERLDLASIGNAITEVGRPVATEYNVTVSRGF